MKDRKERRQEERRKDIHRALQYALSSYNRRKRVDRRDKGGLWDKRLSFNLR